MIAISERKRRSQPKVGSSHAVLEKNAVPFPIPSRCLRLAAAGSILSLGISLALLLLSIPDAAAQPFTSHNPDKDIATSGLGLSDKNPKGRLGGRESKSPAGSGRTRTAQEDFLVLHGNQKPSGQSP